MPRKWKKQKIESRIKTLTPNKLLNKLLVLLAHIKTGNNSCKLKNEIRQITKKIDHNFIESLK